MAVQHTRIMYARTLAQTLHRISDAFPVLMLTGPRQVGKTTLLEMCAQAHRHAEPQALLSMFERIGLGSYPRLSTQGAAARNVPLSKEMMAIPVGYL